MISLDPAKAALANLKPPSPDAAFLKTSMDLAKSGNMFQNPMAGSFSAIDGLGLDSMASTFSKIPGCADLAAQCTKVTANASAIKGVSSQMFTSVMPTSKTLPPALMSMNPSLTDEDKAKLADFSVPSITDVVSTAQAEQEDNERMGTAGDNPCLPVQKTMEEAMAMARKMESGINEVKDDLQAGMKKIEDAYKAVQGATGEALQAAQAALNSAVNSVSGAINEGLNSVSDLVSDAGKSLVDSIKTVRDSAEKSMQLATAGMMKDLIGNNPCMKNVLSPGEDMFETTCEVKIRNAGPDLVKSAGLLITPSNLKVSTNLSSMGYETWTYETSAERVSDTETQCTIKLTYTIDRKKAKERGSPMDTIEHMTSIELLDPDEKYPVGYMFVHESFINLESDSPTLSSVPRVAPPAFPDSYIKLVEEVEWRGAKKKGLLSPEMQKISEQPVEPMPDLPVTTAPAIVQTEEQVKEEAVKEAAEMTPPEIKAEPTKVVVPPAPVKPEPQPPFKKSIEMTKEIKPASKKWKEVHSVTLSMDKIVGSLSVVLTPNGDNPPTINYTYQMDSWQIDEVIAQIMSQARTKIGSDLHYDNIKITYWRKDGTEFGHSYMSFYMSYYAPTQQMSISTGYAAGDSDGYNFKWDWIEYKDDK